MPLNNETLSILQLNERLSKIISTAPGLKNVWVVGETCDVRTSSGHCYLELVEKDERGTNLSRIRAIIWAGTLRSLAQRFYDGTGKTFVSGIKVRVKVTAAYHPNYGMSVTISDIDPAYTAGDAMRHRAEILERLTKEGILELNRKIAWPYTPNRIAVISAPGAAGYGDFINQLLGNTRRFRFYVDFFPAVMQGESTVPTVLTALSAISQQADRYDIVVIIRGGGSTSDLSAFDNYELAAAIARFPLPVIVGIGHERDVTVLDYVANTRVKTPTAAAELLVERIGGAFDALGRAAELIHQTVAARIASHREFLAHSQATVPGAADRIMSRNRSTLERYAMSIATTALTSISAKTEQLNKYCSDLRSAVNRTMERNVEMLKSSAVLLKALSPETVLARGFSLTMLADGTVLRSASQAPAGVVIKTQLAEGWLESQIITESKTSK